MAGEGGKTKEPAGVRAGFFVALISPFAEDDHSPSSTMSSHSATGGEFNGGVKQVHLCRG